MSGFKNIDLAQSSLVSSVEMLELACENPRAEVLEFCGEPTTSRVFFVSHITFYNTAIRLSLSANFILILTVGY